ncbi:MAG: antitoxin [Nocardioidaceae bacterium]
MSTFDSFKDKATDLAKDHPDQASEGLDKAGDLVDEKIGGSHSDQVDSGVDNAKAGLGIGDPLTGGASDDSGSGGQSPEASQSDDVPPVPPA